MYVYMHIISFKRYMYEMLFIKKKYALVRPYFAQYICIYMRVFTHMLWFSWVTESKKKCNERWYYLIEELWVEVQDQLFPVLTFDGIFGIQQPHTVGQTEDKLLVTNPIRVAGNLNELHGEVSQVDTGCCRHLWFELRKPLKSTDPFFHSFRVQSLSYWRILRYYCLGGDEMKVINY